MRNLARYFENKELNIEKMLEYGFIRKDDNYVFEKLMSNTQFKIVVEISEGRKISRIIDLIENDEFELVDVKESTGDFIGKMKEEIESILNELVERCTDYDVFESNQAKKIIEYIQNKYYFFLE